MSKMLKDEHPEQDINWCLSPHEQGMQYNNLSVPENVFIVLWKT